MDRFISEERFQILTSEGKYLSLSLWGEQAAIEICYRHSAHGKSQAQEQAKISKDY